MKSCRIISVFSCNENASIDLDYLQSSTHKEGAFNSMFFFNGSYEFLITTDYMHNLCNSDYYIERKEILQMVKI